MAPKLTSNEVLSLLDRISNWGRWGKGDERGALNFITTEKRAAAARLVRAGETVSMALPLATEPAPDNPFPVNHLMEQAGHDAEKKELPCSSDFFSILPHGHSITHLDALCHFFWNHKMYNGFDADEVGSRGAARCAVDLMSEGVVSRGVLLDMPPIKNSRWLEPGERIFPEDLESVEHRQHVRVERGDVLLIRTGRSCRRKIKGPWSPAREGLAGLDASCLSWLHEREISILGSDGISDVLPSGYEHPQEPIHTGMITMMGVPLIDNADFDALAATAKRLDRYEFQFAMGPLILKGGTASPVNPLAIF